MSPVRSAIRKALSYFYILSPYMQKYELMVILDPHQTDAQLKDLQEEIKNFFGEITYESIWGERQLAYQMGKHRKGFYVVWNFHMGEATQKEMEHHMNLHPGVIRHLIIKVPENYTPFSIEALEQGMSRLSEEKAAKRAKKDGKSTPVKPGQEDKRAERKEVLAEVAEEKAAKKAEKEAALNKEMGITDEEEEAVEEITEEPKAVGKVKEDVSTEAIENAKEDVAVAEPKSAAEGVEDTEPTKSPESIEAVESAQDLSTGAEEPADAEPEASQSAEDTDQSGEEKGEKKSSTMSSEDLDDRLNKIFEDDLDLKM
jgi:small subunit ribosomal protein S6